MNTRTLDRLDALHARLYHWRWWVRAVVTIALAVWLGPAIHSYLTMMPPHPVDSQAPYEPLNVPDAQDDHTAELTALLERIPYPTPALTPTQAPFGRQWVCADYSPRNDWRVTSSMTRIDEGLPFGAEIPAALQCALTGEWSPRSRYMLPHLIRFLQSKIVEDYLRDLSQAAARPFALPASQMVMDTDRPAAATRLLAANARYQIAHRQDVDAAADSLRTILLLAAGLEDDATLFRLHRAQEMRLAALTEMTYWCHEYAFSPMQAAPLTRVLDEHSLDLRTAWKSAMRSVHQISLKTLDSHYTSDAQGNGWYVIHTYNPSATGDRLWCLLNLASPLMTGRQEMIRRIRTYVDRTASLIDLPLETYPQEPQTCPVDGPFVGSQADGYCAVGVVLSACVQTLRAESAARTAIALSVYRHEHGHYPERLDDLVPTYLASLPVDPPRDRPLGYQRNSKIGAGYVLYADVSLVYPRPKPNMELYLRPFPDWHGRAAGELEPPR